MGLINKLEEYQSKDTGLLKRADKLKESTKKVDSFHNSNEMEMLLDQLGDSEDFKKKSFPSTDYLENANTFFDLNKFREDISGFKDDLENPIRLFKLLSKHLKIKKGALLLLNPDDNVFVQYISSNYDKTTQRRLRINTDDKFLKGNNFIFLNEDEIYKFKAFFSIREFSLIKNILVVNFNSFNNTTGLLIISDSGLFSLQKDIIKLIIDEISPFASSILYEARKYFLNSSINHDLKTSENPADSIETIIDNSIQKNENVLFLLISFDKITDYIISSLENTDPYLIKTDLEKILNSMLTENSEIIKKDDNNFILVFSGENIPDEILLKFQINKSIKKLFQELDYFPDLVNSSIMFKHNKNTKDEIIKLVLNENA